MKKFLSIGLLVLLVSCGGGVQYEDANKAKGSKEWGPKEIKDTADIIVSSLYTFLKDEWKKPAFLQVKKFRNKTAEHIETDLLISEIRTRLIKKRIKFIDDSLDKEALEEIAKGQTGLIDPDSAIPAGEMKSPNLYLTGQISDAVDESGGKRRQYLKVSFRLDEIKTRILLWEEYKDFYKISKSTEFDL